MHRLDRPASGALLLGLAPATTRELSRQIEQRLVRKLCPHCKRQDAQGVNGTKVWHPVGCAECSHTGYKGRTGVYELMVADDALRELIHNRAAESQLLATAQGAGLRSMREDGQRLVDAGVTSLEEVLSVTRD